MTGIIGDCVVLYGKRNFADVTVVTNQLHVSSSRRLTRSAWPSPKILLNLYLEIRNRNSEIQSMKDVTYMALKMRGPLWQYRWFLGAENRSWLTVSEDPGTSGLQPQGVKFATTPWAWKRTQNSRWDHSPASSLALACRTLSPPAMPCVGFWAAHQWTNRWFLFLALMNLLCSSRRQIQ